MSICMYLCIYVHCTCLCTHIYYIYYISSCIYLYICMCTLHIYIYLYILININVYINIKYLNIDIRTIYSTLHRKSCKTWFNTQIPSPKQRWKLCKHMLQTVPGCKSFSRIHVLILLLYYTYKQYHITRFISGIVYTYYQYKDNLSDQRRLGSSAEIRKKQCQTQTVCKSFLCIISIMISSILPVISSIIFCVLLVICTYYLVLYYACYWYYIRIVTTRISSSKKLCIRTLQQHIIL